MIYQIQQYTVGNTIVGVAQVPLLQAGTEAVMISANNGLKASQNRPSEAQMVENNAGKVYAAECQRLVGAAGSDGIRQGTAVMTGGGSIAFGRNYRWVIQAVTIHYDHAKHRTPADPALLYGAVRAGLEKAELYHVASVATYLMAQKPGYGTPDPDTLALTLCEALLDHAAIASSVQRLMICETDPVLVQRAAMKLQEAFGNR